MSLVEQEAMVVNLELTDQEDQPQHTDLQELKQEGLQTAIDLLHPIVIRNINHNQGRRLNNIIVLEVIRFRDIDPTIILM